MNFLTYTYDLHYLQQVTKVDKCYPSALHCVGASYLQLNDINKARAAYVTALEFCNATDAPTLNGFSLCFLELDGKNLHNTVSEEFIRSKNDDYTAILNALSPHELTYLNRFSAMKITNDSERDMYVQLLLNYVRALLNSASVSPDCLTSEVVKGDDHAKKSVSSASSHTNNYKNENMNKNENKHGNSNSIASEEYHTNGMINLERNNIAGIVAEDTPYSALSTESAAHCSRCISKAIYILRLITTALPTHPTSAQLLHSIFNGHAMHTESLKVAKRFMGSTPTYHLGHYLMGSSLLESHRQIEAISALDVAVMLNTDTKEENCDMLMKTKFLTAMAHIDGKAYVTAVPLLRDVVHIMESRTFSKESDLYPGMFRGGRTELRVGRNDLERNTYCALGTALSYVRDNLGAYVALLKCVGSFGNQISLEENDQNNWNEETKVGAFQTNPSEIVMYSDMYVQLSNVQRSLGFEEEAKSSMEKSEILLERCPEEMKNERRLRNRENGNENWRKNEIDYVNEKDSERGKDDLINRSKIPNIDDNNSKKADSRSGASNVGVKDKTNKNSSLAETKREAQDIELVRKEEEKEEEVREESVVSLESDRDGVQSDGVSDGSEKNNAENFKKKEKNPQNIYNDSDSIKEMVKRKRCTVSKGGILSQCTDEEYAGINTVKGFQEDHSLRANIQKEIEVNGGIMVEEEEEAEMKGGVEDIKLAGHTLSPLDVLIKSPTSGNPINDGLSNNDMIGKEGGSEADIVQEREEEKPELADSGKGVGTRTGLGVVVEAGLDGENVADQSVEGVSSISLSTNTQTTSSSTTPISTSSTTVKDTSPLKESLGTSTSTSTATTAPSPGNENEKEIVAEAVAGVVKQIIKSIDSLPQGAKPKNFLSIGDSDVESLAAEHSHPVVIAEEQKEEKGKKEEGNEEQDKEEKGKEEVAKEEEGKELEAKEEEEDKSGVQMKQLRALAGHETADSQSSIESDRQGSNVQTEVRADVHTGADAGVHAVVKGNEESQEGGHGDHGARETDAKTGGSGIDDVSASPALLVSNSSSASSTNSSSLSSSLLTSDPSSTSFTNSSSLVPDLLSSPISNSTTVSPSILPSDQSSPSSTNSYSLSPSLTPSESSSSATFNSFSLSSSSPTSNSSSLSSSPISNSTSSSTPGDGALLPPIPPATISKPVPPPPTPAEIRMASQYMMIASAYIGRGDYELALNQLAKAEKKAENYPEMYMLRASVYQALGQVRKNCKHRIFVTL